MSTHTGHDGAKPQTVLASFGLISSSIATLMAGMLLDPLMTHGSVIRP